MAKHLPHKHGDLHWMPRTHIKSQVQQVTPGIPVVGEAEAVKPLEFMAQPI